MKWINRTRLSLESLESRLTPALSVAPINGVLTISGDPVGELVVTQTAQDDWEINDLGTVGVDYPSIIANAGVKITLTGFGDTLTLNTAAGTLINGPVTIYGSNGDDVIRFNNDGNGMTITNLVNIVPGNGNDTINLSSNAGGTVSIQGTTTINMGNGTLEAVTVPTNVTVQGNMTVSGAEIVDVEGDIQGRLTVTFNKVSTTANTLTAYTDSVLGSLYVTGTTGAENISIEGDILGVASIALGNGLNSFSTTTDSEIGGPVTYTGGTGNDAVTLDGIIYGSLTATLGASLAGGNDFTLNGAVGGFVSLNSDGGPTSMTFNSTSVINGNLTVTTRSTANIFVMDGTLNGSRFTYNGGGGVDTVTWNALNSSAYLAVNLGAGNDFFTLSSTAFNGGRIDGGFGTDDLTLNVSQGSLVIVGFEL